MTRFNYASLEHKDSIRLFRMREGQNNDLIVCDIYHTRLSEQPDFIALSYAWKEPITDEILGAVCDDERWRQVMIRHEHSQTQFDFSNLDVGLNTLAALRMLRTQNETGTSFWVDMICIDQTHLDEKSQQVAIMGEIYRMAASVFVWLGEETETDHLAFEALKDIPSLRAVKPGELPFLGSRSDMSSESVQKFIHEHGLHSSNEADWSKAYHALRGVIARSWFSRVWCVQEVCLGSLTRLTDPELVCGSLRLGLRYVNAFQDLMFSGLRDGYIRADVTFLLRIGSTTDVREKLIQSWDGSKNDIDWSIAATS